jgi:hypothetical protein
LSAPLFSGVRRIGLRVDAQVFQGTLITLLNKGVFTDKMNRFVTGRVIRGTSEHCGEKRAEAILHLRSLAKSDGWERGIDDVLETYTTDDPIHAKMRVAC